MTTQAEERYRAKKPAASDASVPASFNGCYQDCRCRCDNTTCGCHEGNRNGVQHEPSARERRLAHAR